MARSRRATGFLQPFIEVLPQPLFKTSAPTTSDKNYDIGQVWVYKSGDTRTAYIYGGTDSSDDAVWILGGPGSSDVDTISGDSGTATPSSGNINIVGGTNITTTGASPTGDDVSVDLDDAISLATSVTSPIYTVAAATDLSILGVSGQDVIVTLGGSAGSENFIVEAADSTELWKVASDGTITFSSLTVTGAFTSSGGAISLNASSNFNTVINSGTSTGSVTIGNSAAGAITVASGSGISIDTATASSFTVTGTGENLTLASVGGSVLMSSTENAALALYLHANGGTSETIQIHSDQGTGASSVYLLSDVGGLTLEATALASADAINIVATLGGIDMDSALQTNIASSQDAADALRFISSAGGIDIDAVGEAGQDINITNTGGSLVLVATEAIADGVVLQSTNGGIDILAPGAGAGLDIDIVNTGGSINLSATEADAGALSLTAANGGMAISLGLALIADAAGNVEINSSAGTILIGNDDVDQDMDFGTDGERTVTVGSTNGAAALVLQAGTGNITMTGTVDSISSKQVINSGSTITFKSSPLICTADDTGGVATGTGGDINLLSFKEGLIMEQFIIGTQTIIKPVMNSAGLLASLDLTNGDGVEYNFGAARSLSEYAFTIGTDAAFFFQVEMTVADISGGNPYIIGFRKSESNNATYSAYTDYYALGMIAGTSATNITLTSELNGGGQTLQDSGTVWTGGDGGTVTLQVLVSAAGVVTATIDGGDPSSPLAYTFDSADVVCPFIHLVHNGDAGAINIVSMSVGYQ